ncbi:MAG: patatin-like phospholipase family protein [Rubrivivax sp.]
MSPGFISHFRLFRRMGAFAGLLAGLLWSARPALGQEAPTAPVAVPPALAASAPETPRPRVALVLSGGGARGFAHVGVLRVLEELRVPVDIVVGASMGAVVGGAYASGRSVAELEAFVRSTDWRVVVSDRVDRQMLNLRRKEDDLEVPSRIELSVTSDGLRGPPAAAHNAAVEDALARLLPPEARTAPVSSLPVRFRAAATDLLTGELVKLDDTPLLPSLRASMAVPGVFQPVRLDDRLVVDGGLVRNLPVDLARALGAEVIIAVNAGTPLAGEETLGTAFGVAQQMLNILTEQNVQRSLAELTAADVLIAPDLGGVGFLDFGASERAMQAGARAARAVAGRLQTLALPPPEYVLHRAARTRPRADPDMPRVVARLAVTGTRVADPRVLEAESGLRVGQPVTLADVERAADRLRGRSEFDRVEAQVRDTVIGREVALVATESEWARSRLRVGLEFSSDFRDDHRFQVSGLHVLSWLNDWGGELRTIGRVGSERSLATEWWQPLSPGSPWYASASLGYLTKAENLFIDGKRFGRASLAATTATVSLGRLFDRRGEVRLGLQRNVGKGRLLLPRVDDDTAPFGETNAFIRVRYDTLENLAFPTEGGLLDVLWQRGRAAVDGVPSLNQSQAVAMRAFRLGEWGGHLYGEWSRSADGFSPQALGGFLRLSGASRDSISGGTLMFARAVVARRVGQTPAGLGGAIRAGVSLEVGEGFAPDEAIRWSALRLAGSAFVSVDTRFGPAYLALGASRGSSTVYVFLGPFW